MFPKWYIQKYNASNVCFLSKTCTPSSSPLSNKFRIHTAQVTKLKMIKLQGGKSTHVK